MQKRSFTIVLAGAIALAAACEKSPTELEAATPSAALEAAQIAEGHHGARPAPIRNPIPRLIAMRRRLGLTDEQVSRLRSIQSELRTKNAPLVEKVRAAMGARDLPPDSLRGLTREQRRARIQQIREQRRQKLAAMTPEQRKALREERRAKMKELQPVLKEIRANTRAALKSAKDVLTPEQRAKVAKARRAHAERGRQREGNGARQQRRTGRSG